MNWHGDKLRRFATDLKMILGAAAIVFAAGYAAVQSWADDRYVLKGELQASIASLENHLAEAERARQREATLAAILDLEDDVVAFSEDNDANAVRRCCRKLVRYVRRWEQLSPGMHWQQDQVVKRACGG